MAYREPIIYKLVGLDPERRGAGSITICIPLKLFPCFFLFHLAGFAGFGWSSLASLTSNPAPIPRVVGHDGQQQSTKHNTLASCHPINSCVLLVRWPTPFTILPYGTTIKPECPLSLPNIRSSLLFSSPKTLPFLPNRDPLSHHHITTLIIPWLTFLLLYPRHLPQFPPQDQTHQYPIRPWFINAPGSNCCNTSPSTEKNCVQFS
ncbi:uncharacterized protein F4812DRAFT_47739 [Daldinia caldariorum]|uniref:uncharacterized protein n=1 Tax=Daldinia caldariorum TaxID=326644 RepID=UPI0020088FF8|nr:uncharacterized protein F4812DRAFT_47739 [Daldinia caldariorum]KAI1467068.1 hypothetical protein F4812DRAFT_47739 [Daldinia caldariorum]